MEEWFFLKDGVGILWDEIPSCKIKEYIDNGWFVETIRAEYRWQAHKLAEERNCELLHTLTGSYCTCGSHDF